ncbi:MAG TPA: indolepyruvate oxidoreductase subunit beta [Desulfurivibrio alkaliphilus]|uniref:Indolepyruvate oxidoreductase subunit beta n=1 Tax=Desulfurivibrio alkaliphilus TaxID=427923 RepID=A0A7C2XRG0_9BACT|nr:indolepyruvate oxidoreductase subunit beta [Desulfurivibrio alkaliphilus]
MSQSGNIHFVGVGGQGVLLASEMTAYALLAAGFDIKKSEVHGMAQRGGSVEAHLRYGSERVYSPLIEPGTVDIQLAFETMEAARYLPYLNRQSKVIVNTQRIMPPAVATGKMAYPDHCLEALTSKKIEVLPVDAYAIAKQLGNIRAANVVLVGALSTFLPLDSEIFEQVIKRRLPAKIQEVNLLAFAAGREQTR